MSSIVKKLRSIPDVYSMSGASGAQIDHAEMALNLRFSSDYREYLAAFGVASACGHELTGICDFPRLNVVDVTVAERISNPTVPGNWYVVEQANIDSIVVWQSTTGEVWQTMPNTPPGKLCRSLCEYLEL